MNAVEGTVRVILLCLMTWMFTFIIVRSGAVDTYKKQHCVALCKADEPTAHYDGDKFSCTCTRSAP